MHGKDGGTPLTKQLEGRMVDVLDHPFTVDHNDCIQCPARASATRLHINSSANWPSGEPNQPAILLQITAAQGS